MRDFLSQTLARCWDTRDKSCRQNLVLGFPRKESQNDF